MSGAVRSGLIFGVTAIILTLAVSFVPLVGALLCSPLIAVVLGGIAGYLGVQWSAGNAGAGSGALAGGLTGVGVLIGTIAYFVIALTFLTSSPDFQEQLLEQFRQQNPNVEIDPDTLATMLNLVGPLAGFCVGLIELVIALGFGTLGGYIAARNRAPSAPPPPMPPPPMAPMG